MPADLHTELAHYEIRVQGHLRVNWTAWFDGMQLSAQADGTTVLDGPVVDQAALHGLLQRLRDIGLTLISVTQISPSTNPRSTP